MQPKSSGYSSTTQIQDPSSPGNNLILLGGSLAAEEETQWEEIQSKSTVISNSISMWISWRAAAPCSTREHWLGLAQRFGSLLFLPAASSCSLESTVGTPACAKAASCMPALLSLETLSVHTKDTTLLLYLGLGNSSTLGTHTLAERCLEIRTYYFSGAIFSAPGSAAQQQLLLGAPCRVIPATCPLLPAWGRAVLPAGRHQQGGCSPCSLQAVTAPVAQGGAHTCPVCASRARDIATLRLCRMGQDSGTLFSPSPTHCHAGERGLICAGHGANMACDNLHFCYFLFPGKRGKVTPVLAIVGCILPYSKAMV